MAGILDRKVALVTGGAILRRQPDVSKAGDRRK